MDLEIIKEFENKLIGRKEIEFQIQNAKLTPSRKELVKKISALKNAKEEQIIIGNLAQLFGSNTVRGQARIYDSVKMLEKSELKGIIARHRPKEKKEKEGEEETTPEKEPEQKSEKKEETEKQQEEEQKKEKVEKADEKAAEEKGKQGE